MREEDLREELERLFSSYPQAARFFSRFEKDPEIAKFHHLANNYTVNRLGYNDHGRVHAYIVARNSLKLLEILLEAGLKPNLIKEALGDLEDVALVVALAGFLHDIGNAIHRVNHHLHSVILARPFLEKHLRDHRNKEVITATVLEAIYSHEAEEANSIEASIVKVADGMDMEEGRARIPYQRGKFDIHAVSALSIKRVSAGLGTKRPLRITVEMEHTAGLFQVEEVLGRKIKTSKLRGKVEVVLKISGMEQRVLFF